MTENNIIETVHLFPVLEEKLIELLRSLTPEEWNRPTIAKMWTVKDVAAHLLDGNLRTISTLRDRYFCESPSDEASNETLVAFLNRLNENFVSAMLRVSPARLIEMMELTGKQYNQLVTAVDPTATAVYPVSWAGEEHSVN